MEKYGNIVIIISVSIVSMCVVVVAAFIFFGYKSGLFASIYADSQMAAMCRSTTEDFYGTWNNAENGLIQFDMEGNYQLLVEGDLSDLEAAPSDFGHYEITEECRLKIISSDEAPTCAGEEGLYNYSNWASSSTDGKSHGYHLMVVNDDCMLLDHSGLDVKRSDVLTFMKQEWE